MCSRGTRLRPALTRTCCSLASCKAMKSPTQLTRTSCAINNLTRFIPAPCPASGFCPTLRKLILCTGFNEKYYSTSFLSMYRILCLILSRFKLYGYDQIRSPIIYNFDRLVVYVQTVFSRFCHRNFAIWNLEKSIQLFTQPMRRTNWIPTFFQFSPVNSLE